MRKWHFCLQPKIQMWSQSLTQVADPLPNMLFLHSRLSVVCHGLLLLTCFSTSILKANIPSVRTNKCCSWFYCPFLHQFDIKLTSENKTSRQAVCGLWDHSINKTSLRNCPCFDFATWNFILLQRSLMLHKLSFTLALKENKYIQEASYMQSPL